MGGGMFSGDRRRESSGGLEVAAWAFRRSRFRRRMYQPRPKKTDNAKDPTPTAIPAFAPSESWFEGGMGATSSAVALGGGEVLLGDADVKSVLAFDVGVGEK